MNFNMDYATQNRKAYLENFQPLEQQCKRGGKELTIAGIILVVLAITFMIL